MKKLVIARLLSWLAFWSLTAQDTAAAFAALDLSATTATAEEAGVFLRFTDEKIIVDGHLEEDAWFTGRAATNFWENFPSDSTRCDWPTEIFIPSFVRSSIP